MVGVTLLLVTKNLARFPRRHVAYSSRVPRSRKRKLWNLTPSPALPLITQIYLRISQMSFLTHQNPKDALKMLQYRAKSHFCENGANNATNDRLRIHINNISYKHSSHIIIWAWIRFWIKITHYIKNDQNALYTKKIPKCKTNQSSMHNHSCIIIMNT